jgi:hypothetical protein
MDKNISEIITRLFQSFIVLIAGFFATEFSNLSKSIQQLNQNVAVLIERTTTQSQQIIRIDERVTSLELSKPLKRGRYSVGG